jgi:hypothetical protein
LKKDNKSNHHTISNLEKALGTYRTRNRVYGNNYKRFGAIMMALYPKGVTINTEHQWNRFGIIIQKISKLGRYVTNPLDGHIDSIHDDAVYSFMLQELDSEAAGLDVTPPEPLITVKNCKEALPNPCEHIYRCRCTTDEQQCDNVCKMNHGMICIRCGETERRQNDCIRHRSNRPPQT